MNNWYQQLIKPEWAPPAYLFGPVWSMLYVVIAATYGYAGWMFFTGKIRFMVFLPFILNIVFNIAFTPIQGQTSTVYQIKFELDLPNSDLKYKVGMNGDAKIKLAEVKDVQTVPVEAVFEEKDEKFVYLRTEKSKIERRVVKTGLENDTDVEITDGLKEGETIIY